MYLLWTSRILVYLSVADRHRYFIAKLFFYLFETQLGSLREVKIDDRYENGAPADDQQEVLPTHSSKPERGRLEQNDGSCACALIQSDVRNGSD